MTNGAGSLCVRGAAKVFRLDAGSPVRGAAFQSILPDESASVVCDDGRVTAVGEPRDAEVALDATGCTVVPGFVDPHTHLPFYG